MLLSRLCAALLALSVLLGQRVLIGGANPFGIAFIAAAAIMFVIHDPGPSREKPYRALMLNTVGPLLALYFVLPFVAVLIGRYEVRNLYTWIIPGTILGILSLARASRLRGLRLDRLGFGMILIHGLYGLGQSLNRMGVLPTSLWSWAIEWDRSSQAALNEAYIISNRSTGLFVNANLFGMWSCVALVFSFTLLRGKQRAAGVFLSVVGVLGSQSRTALAVVVVLALVHLLRVLRDGKLAGATAVTLTFVLPAAIGAWLLGWLTPILEAGYLTRIQSGLGVASGGVESDVNLDARTDAWRRALDFSSQYPFGTWGPPEKLFGGFIDNEYVSLYVQGSILMVLAYVAALLSPLLLARRGVPHSGALAVVAVSIALFSLTMAPLEAVGAAALVWLMVAACVSMPTEGAPPSASRPMKGRPRSRAARAVRAVSS